MGQLQKIIDQTEARVLDDLKAALVRAKAAVVEPLKAQIVELQQSYKSDRDVSLSNSMAEAELAAERRFKAELRVLKDQEIKSAWMELAEVYLADEANLKAWLETKLTSLPLRKAEIKAGRSYRYLSGLLRSNTFAKLRDKVELVKSSELAEVDGFEYSSKNTQIDYTLPAYLEEAYRKNRKEIFSLLTSTLSVKDPQ